MKKTVFSILSILSIMAFLLFAGCAEDLPDNEDFSPDTHLKSGIVDSPVDGRGSKVVYSSFRGGAPPSLWAMNIDGTNLTRLTTGINCWGFKDISPDGQKVVFHSRGDIYIKSLDQSGYQQLTDFPGPDNHPRFTPDGEKIVFTSAREDDAGEIYTMNLDGSEVERLTYLYYWNHSPCISRNGKELLFVRAIGIHGDIYKMDLITGDTVRLTFTGFQKHVPSWSPDGKKIVFAARVGPFVPPNNPPYDIFVMDTDGSNIENLTNYLGEDRSPCWSPDGRHIIFHRKDPGKPQQLWLMKADGSDPVQITDKFSNHFPSWGPGRID